MKSKIREDTEIMSDTEKIRLRKWLSALALTVAGGILTIICSQLFEFAIEMRKDMNDMKIQISKMNNYNKQFDAIWIGIAGGQNDIKDLDKDVALLKILEERRAQTKMLKSICFECGGDEAEATVDQSEDVYLDKIEDVLNKAKENTKEEYKNMYMQEQRVYKK